MKKPYNNYKIYQIYKFVNFLIYLIVPFHFFLNSELLYNAKR